MSPSLRRGQRERLVQRSAVEADPFGLKFSESW